MISHLKKLFGLRDEEDEYMLTPAQREVVHQQEQLQDELNMLRLRKEKDTFK